MVASLAHIDIAHGQSIFRQPTLCFRDDSVTATSNVNDFRASFMQSAHRSNNFMNRFVFGTSGEESIPVRWLFLNKVQTVRQVRQSSININQIDHPFTSDCTIYLLPSPLEDTMRAIMSWIASGSPSR